MAVEAMTETAEEVEIQEEADVTVAAAEEVVVTEEEADVTVAAAEEVDVTAVAEVILRRDSHFPATAQAERNGSRKTPNPQRPASKMANPSNYNHRFKQNLGYSHLGSAPICQSFVQIK